MQPMASGWALGLIALGTACNLLGLYCGGKAFLASWRRYGDGELWPWLAHAIGVARALLRRVIFWRKPKARTLSLNATASGSSSLEAYLSQRPGFADPGTDTQRFAMLQHAIELAFDQMSRDQERANRKHAETQMRLSSIASQLENEARRLEGMSREIASGGVQLQLLGLMAIGVGTVLTTLPSIWDTVVVLVGGR
jgi:hypothetical protein